MTAARPPRSASLARTRLLGDRAMRPVAEQRVQLGILSDRLERAARSAMTQHLSVKVRSDRRFAPMLGRLMRMSLQE